MPITVSADGGDDGVLRDYRWISPVRAAALLDIDLRDVYRLIDRGDLPAYRIAGEIRLLARDVEAYRDPTAGDPAPGDP